MKFVNHLPDLIVEYEAKIGRTVKQKEIANEAQITQATFSRYLNGHLASLKLDIEYKLCQFFSDKLDREIGRDDLISFEFDEAG